MWYKLYWSTCGKYRITQNYFGWVIFGKLEFDGEKFSKSWLTNSQYIHMGEMFDREYLGELM